MKHVRSWIGAFVVLCLLSSCSSGAKPTISSSTTLPPARPSAATIAAVRKYLTGIGAPLIEFEHATSVLATGTPPTKAACIHIATSVLPHITKGPSELLAFAAKIPDPMLQAGFHADITNKNLVLLACEEYKVPPTAAGLFTIHLSWEELRGRLALFAVAI